MKTVCGGENILWRKKKTTKPIYSPINLINFIISLEADIQLHIFESILFCHWIAIFRIVSHHSNFKVVTYNNYYSVYHVFKLLINACLCWRKTGFVSSIKNFCSMTKINIQFCFWKLWLLFKSENGIILRHVTWKVSSWLWDRSSIVFL